MSTILAMLLLSVLFHQIHAQSVECSGNCQCPSSVSQTTCILNCNGKDQCKDSTLKCRAGDPCIINCSGENSCEGNTFIDGSDASHVRISCLGDGACKGNTVLSCGTQSCQVTCDRATSCDGTTARAYSATSFLCSGSCSSFASVPAPFHQTTLTPSSSTSTPTVSATETPTQTTSNPTNYPTEYTQNPSTSPTKRPTNIPTDIINPTLIPTENPVTTTPTKGSTSVPTNNHNTAPTSSTTTSSTSIPTSTSYATSTANPSKRPTSPPVKASHPTIKSSVNPTISPTVLPTQNPVATIVADREVKTTKTDENEQNVRDEADEPDEPTTYVIGANPMWYIVIGSASLIICGSIVCCCAIFFYYKQTQAVLVENNKQFSPKIVSNVTSPTSGERKWNPYADEATYKDADADANVDGYILTVPPSVLQPGADAFNNADEVNNDVVIDTKGCDINESQDSHSEPLPESDSDESSTLAAKKDDIVTTVGNPQYNQTPAIFGGVSPGIYNNMMSYSMPQQNGPFMPYVIVPQSSVSPHMMTSPPVIMSSSLPRMPPHLSQ